MPNGGMVASNTGDDLVLPLLDDLSAALTLGFQSERRNRAFELKFEARPFASPPSST
ncbi:MAG: hypothetical protein ACOYN0_12700 [Phycisphaerales bacterium]